MKKGMVWHVVLAGYVLFIYFNSLTPASVSSQESSFVLELVRGLFDKAGISALWLTEHIIRKTAHFCEYTLLGILLTQSMNQIQCLKKVRILLQLQLSMAIPFVDETLQLFTAGRSGQLSDVWLDMSGVLAGTAAAALFIWLRNMRRKT